MSGQPHSKGSGQGDRLAALAETALLCGLGVIAIFWIIPAETSGNALGLDPAYMPTLYATITTVLVLANGVLSLAELVKTKRVPGSFRAVAPVMIVTGLGIAAFQLFGPAACGLVVLPAMMLALGERRPLLIAGTTVTGVAALLLMLG